MNQLIAITIAVAALTSPVWVVYAVIKFVQWQDRKKKPVLINPDEIPEPPEGFKNGGWYQGHQYFNGSFSDKGVLHDDYKKTKGF